MAASPLTIRYNKLERVLEGLVKEGKLGFMEYSAITGCCELMAELRLEAFASQYGTASVEALTGLMKTEPATKD